MSDRKPRALVSLGRRDVRAHDPVPEVALLTTALLAHCFFESYRHLRDFLLKMNQLQNCADVIGSYRIQWIEHN